MSSAESKYLNRSFDSYSQINKRLQFSAGGEVPADYNLSNSKVLSYVWELSKTNISFKERLQLLCDKFKLEGLANRLENCRRTGWITQICNKCNKIVYLKRLSCLSPYCDDSECIRNRKNINYKILQLLNIKNKQLIHLVVGFEFVDRFTKEIRKDHQKIISLLAKEMSRLGSPMRMIIVRDLNQRGKQLYVHYHIANLPSKGFSFRKFGDNLVRARENIIKKTNIQFTIKSKGFRPIESIYRYFINRLSGVFGDIKKQRYYHYRDLMDLKTYYECFYNTRRLRFINLRHPRANEVSSYLALLLDKQASKCPFCQSKDLHVEIIMRDKPPPGCLACGLPVQIKKGKSFVACELCSRPRFPQHEKMLQAQNRFARYYSAIHKEKIRLDFNDEIDLAVKGVC